MLGQMICLSLRMNVVAVLCCEVYEMEKKYLYNIGDIVKIRDRLSCYGHYCMISGPGAGRDPGINQYMIDRCGEIHTITGYTPSYYLIDDEPDETHEMGPFSWSDEMLELAKPECFCQSLL